MHFSGADNQTKRIGLKRCNFNKIVAAFRVNRANGADEVKVAWLEMLLYSWQRS